MYNVVLLPTQDHHHLSNASHTFFVNEDFFFFFNTKFATGLSHPAGDLQYFHSFTVWDNLSASHDTPDHSWTPWPKGLFQP